MKIDDFLPIGIIDVGSNSIRGFYADGSFGNKKSIITRLGEGLATSDFLLEKSIRASIIAIKTLIDDFNRKGVKDIYIFATAAVRSAKNGDEFVLALKKTFGIDVDVVSGELEGRLALLGALDGNDGGIIDIGGASSEVAVMKDGEVEYDYSLNEGAVKLYGKFGRNREEVDSYVKARMVEYGTVPKTSFKAVGGAPTTLAAIDLELRVYDPLKVHNHYISKERLLELEDMVTKMSPDEICSKYAVVKQRAETIVCSTSLLFNIVDYLGIDGITISENDNAEGYLYYLRNK